MRNITVQRRFGPDIVDLPAAYYHDFTFSFPTVGVPEFCPRSQYLTLAQHPHDGWNRQLFRNVGNQPTHTVQQPRRTKISNKILFAL
jgi:hypothetical protein